MLVNGPPVQQNRETLGGSGVMDSANQRASTMSGPHNVRLSKVVAMTTVIAVHEVTDVAHWLSSSKRAEFFGAHGMTVRTFVAPGGGNRVGVIIDNVLSLEALNEALQGADAAEAMKHDGVDPDTVELFVSS